MTSIYSWNVNGIRACEKKGFTQWLNKVQPDVLCIQETKAQDDQIPESVKNTDFYIYHAQATKKGYSGVATLTKEKPIEVEIGLGIDEFDCEGRTVITHFKEFIVINGYFPNGQRDHGRVDYKLDYSEFVLQTALTLKEKYKKEIVICGDYNTAHNEIDLANPKTNHKTTGFLPRERAWMDNFFSNGFYDTFRHLHPSKEGAYTWWTYRGDCRARNVGWRIDYISTTEKLLAKINNAETHPNVMGSDHCPISISF